MLAAATTGPLDSTTTVEAGWGREINGRAGTLTYLTLKLGKVT